LYRGPSLDLPVRLGFPLSSIDEAADMDVLQAYVRDADLFRDHAGTGLL
jgi:hypothetical protein